MFSKNLTSIFRERELNVSHKKGFTLIELLVVIAIIGLLASIVLVSMQGVRGKARDSRRMQELKQLQTAVELYYDKYESYPSTGNQWWSYCNAWVGNKDTSGPNSWIPNLAPEFMGGLPLDPLRGTNRGALTGPTGGTGNEQFCYIYNSNGIDYKIAAHCAAETGPRNSGDSFYKGHDGWSCDNYHFAVWSPGAQGW